MPILARLLAVALALPLPYYEPGHSPETAETRAERVSTIVSAAVSESMSVEDWPGTPAELASALLAVTWYESRRWAVEVHDGHVRGDKGASVCLAQIWTRDLTLAGTSPAATGRCLHRAAEILTLHAKRCGLRSFDEQQMARLLGAYGTGRTCRVVPWARKRATLWTRFMRAATDPAMATREG